MQFVCRHLRVTGGNLFIGTLDNVASRAGGALARSGREGHDQPEAPHIFRWLSAPAHSFEARPASTFFGGALLSSPCKPAALIGTRADLQQHMQPPLLSRSWRETSCPRLALPASDLCTWLRACESARCINVHEGMLGFLRHWSTFCKRRCWSG